MGKYLERQVTKIDSRRNRNMNSPITSKKTELVVFKSSHKEIRWPHGLILLNI